MNKIIKKTLTSLNYRIHHVYEILSIKLFNEHTLKSVLIEINSACNRRCVWCPNHKNPREKNEFLDEDLFYSVIDQLSNIGFKGKLAFHLFNETLLDKRLPYFVKYVKEKLPYTHIYINTNGDFLSMELWNSLRRQGLDSALISQYDGKYSKKVKEIYEALDDEEKKYFRVRLFNQENHRNRAGLIATTSDVPLKRICERPFYQLCINYKGKAVLCCNDYFGKVDLGDIRTDSIKNIWEGDIMRRYRNQLKYGRRNKLELCDKCDM